MTPRWEVRRDMSGIYIYYRGKLKAQVFGGIELARDIVKMKNGQVLVLPKAVKPMRKPYGRPVHAHTCPKCKKDYRHHDKFCRVQTLRYCDNCTVLR